MLPAIPHGGEIFLTGRQLFDGRTPGGFDDRAIEVEEGRIVDVGPRSASMPPTDVVDLAVHDVAAVFVRGTRVPLATP